MLRLSLWASDGTEEGTRLVADLPDRFGSSFRTSFGSFIGAGDLMFFTIGDFETRQLWRSDETRTGTFPLTTLDTGGDSLGLVSALNRIFFTGFTAASGWELWTSDGTVAGTGMVVDYAPAASSRPYFLTGCRQPALRSSDLRALDQRGPAWDLWRSDGTPDGTVLVAPTPPASGIYDVVAGNGRVFFTRYTQGVFGLSLWSSDGTENGAVLLTDNVANLYRRDPVRRGARRSRSCGERAAGIHQRGPGAVGKEDPRGRRRCAHRRRKLIIDALTNQG